MKTTIYFCLAVLCLVTGRGFTDEKAPVTTPIRARLIQIAPAGARDMSLLHRWENTQILGFNAQGRLLVYAAARQRFEAHELTTTNGAVTGWQNPDGGPHAGGAFSPDGRTLATVSVAGKDRTRIRLWNSATGEPSGPTFAPTDVAYLAFSPDGKSLAGVASLSGTVRIWDVASGELRSSGTLTEPPQVTWTGIQFSPDGRYLAARNSFAHSVWNLGERTPVLATEPGNIYLAISPDWKLAFGVATDDRKQGLLPRLFDFADPGKPRPAPKPFPDETANALNTAAFSFDGRLMALNFTNDTFRLWDTTQGCLLDQPTIKVGRLIRLALSPDNRLLLTHEFEARRRGGFAGNLRVWEVATGQPCGPPVPIKDMFLDHWFDREARFLAVAFPQGNGYGAQVWKLPSGKAPPAQSPEPATSGNRQPNSP